MSQNERKIKIWSFRGILIDPITKKERPVTAIIEARTETEAFDKFNRMHATQFAKLTANELKFS